MDEDLIDDWDEEDYEVFNQWDEEAKNKRLEELDKQIQQKDAEIERLNNIIEKTESMLKRLMEEQEYCYKKYPENWEERIGVSNTWLTSRDCYWSALNYLIKQKKKCKLF